MRAWDYYDDMAYMYDSQYEEPYWKLYHLITQRLIERLIRQNGFKSPLKVLDLGSGTGFWMEYFLERGDKVTCLEPSEKMIEIIKIKSEALEKKVSIEKAICEKIPLADNQFDIVNAQGDVLSYSFEPLKAISEAYRVLKPGGLLIGSVDSIFAFLNDAISVGDIETFKKTERTKRSIIGNSQVSKKTFETTLFSPEDIENILTENHFTDIEIAGKVVFGPYEEEALIEKMNQIAALEEQHCFSKSLLGKAEHLHFSSKKPSNK